MIQINGEWKHTPEEIQKMSLSQKGRLVSELTKSKMKLSHWSKSGNYVPGSSRVSKICENCKMQFEAPLSRDKTAVACSKSCRYELMRGRMKDMAPKLTPEIREKIRQTKERNGGQRGERNPRWRGGITPINRKIRNSDEYKEWRLSIFRRDRFTCVLCKSKPPKIKIEADHIKPFALFPELRLEITNGRTLCRPCHKQITPSYNFYG